MKKHQSLRYYKRHTPTCDLRADKLSFDCGCPIWLTGTTDTGETIPRTSTGWADMTRAKDFAATLINKRLQVQAKPGARGLTIPYAIESYLLSRRDDTAESTLRKYVDTLNKFSQFCYSIGVHYMYDISIDLLQTFNDRGLTGRSSTRCVHMGKMKAFITEAFRRDWILTPLNQRMRKYQITSQPTKPFTEDEVAKILEGALIQPRGGGRYTGESYRSQPQTFRLLMEFMLETGMRVGDAVRFTPSALRKGEYSWEYTFRQQKQQIKNDPKSTTVYISDRLKTAIDACHWFTPTRPFLLRMRPERKQRLEDGPTGQVYKYMQGIGRKMGVEECRPHRLRDTFALRALLAGASLDDVSKLLGHSSVKITEKYYAGWCKDRQNRLARIAATCLQNVPLNGVL